MAEVKKAFNPEFLNRLDEVILFTSLADEDLLQIISLLVEQININLVAKQIKIRVNEDAAKYILEKTMVDRSYGARPLRRALQKFIEDPLSEALIQGTLPRPSELEVYLGETGIYCRPIASETSGELQEQPVGAPRTKSRRRSGPRHSALPVLICTIVQMKVYEVQKGATSLDGLRPSERPDPQPGPREVLIRVRATSLNYRDQMVVTGKYFGGPVSRNLIPLSDGAGEVAAVGAGVTRFKTGDRVCWHIFPNLDLRPHDRAASRARQPSGWNARRIYRSARRRRGAYAENFIVRRSRYAALRRGHGLERSHGVGQACEARRTVLCLGTGGVSMAGLLFAKAAGRARHRHFFERRKNQASLRAGRFRRRQLQALPRLAERSDRNSPAATAPITFSKTADAGSLTRSFEAAAFGGKVALIGFLAGEGDINPAILMMKSGAMIGIGVGSRAMFEDMNRAIDVNKIKPVVDRVFPFDKAADAYRCQAAGDFLGKVVITV